MKIVGFQSEISAPVGSVPVRLHLQMVCRTHSDEWASHGLLNACVPLAPAPPPNPHANRWYGGVDL